MSALWAIVGATGTGKSALAMALCERVGGELISVDSAQVFRGLDLGTAKPTREEQARVVHHLIDVIEPDAQWTGAAFAEAAELAIAEVRARGRVPILCGGTGLWLRALVRGFFEAPPIAPELRAHIRQRLEAEGAPALHAELVRLDPVSAARLHPHDTQRIGRALEYVLETGVPISTAQAAHGFRELRHRWVGVALDWPRAPLVARLEARTIAMYRAGLLDEVRGLFARGVSPEGPGLSCIGYREAVRCVRGEWTEAQALEATHIATRQYAKRQGNWFRHDPEVAWLGPEATVDEALASLRARDGG
jgi:tRNA dimethylallyltransferase